MILLDTDRAHDTVWIKCLLFKLIGLRLPDYHLSCYKYYVEGLTCIVHLNDSTSTPKLTLSALTQGTVLSTTLFSLRLSAMPRPPHTHLPSYADVTALLTQSC